MIHHNVHGITKFSAANTLLEIPDLEREEKDGRRFYRTPSGNLYPSITTLLSFLGKEYIDKWRNNIGHKEADSILHRSGTRGTIMHDLLEEYLHNNLTEYFCGFYAHEMFQCLKKELDQHVNNIYMTEKYLYNDLLMLAGTVDVIAEWDGVLSIIDFKNSLRYKSLSDIMQYCLQVTAYAYMAEELFNLKIEQAIILIAVESEEKAQIFKINPKDYFKELCKFRRYILKTEGI